MCTVVTNGIITLTMLDKENIPSNRITCNNKINCKSESDEGLISPHQINTSTGTYNENIEYHQLGDV